MTTNNNPTNEAESNLVKVIRGLVRPVITFLVILALVVVVVFLVIKYADAETGKSVVAGFMTLVASIVGFWFGSRKSDGTG